MLAHKLVLDDVVDQPFKLIALHCSVEEYKLAYLLNKHLKLRLARARNDIDFYIDSMRALFALYTYYDKANYNGFYLVSNVFRGELDSSAQAGSLFSGEEGSYKRTFLLPEFSKVDYLFKIESDSLSEKLLLARINEIPQIATAYCIDDHQIKSKENLIFD